MSMNLLKWLLLFANVSDAVPGFIRRQTVDTCSCPTNGLQTTTFVPVTTSTITLTVQGDTVTNTGSTTTEVVTTSVQSTVIITTGTTTITYPGVTTTTTDYSTTTNTVTVTQTQTSCSIATRKVKRQGTSTAATTTSPPAVITTVLNVSSRPATCTCTYIPQTMTFPSSSCSCPATSSTVTVTASSTSTVFVTETATTALTVETTPGVTITTTLTDTVTSATLETATTSESSLTITSQPVVTEVVTLTATSITCPSSTTSTSATPLATQPLICNSTAYLIGTPPNSHPTLYNIDLATSNYFPVNSNVGNSAYTAINAMGYNVLDNYLYGIAQATAGVNLVLRISATGITQEVARFSQADAPTAGDIDPNGQFWITATGGTQWRHIDLAPGSATYGRTIENGTTTLTGYGVYDFVFLPGQTGYFFSLAVQTTSNPTLTLLRFSTTTHTWAVNQTTTYPAPNNEIANWGSRNGTLWGLAATSGDVVRQTLGGTPVRIGTAPGGLTYADGARCALSLT